MQLQCKQCHRPFALSKAAVENALDMLEEESLNHYNAVCPHCRRTNQVSKQQLQRAAPGWQKKESADAET
jgi:hypothetical protein